MESVITLVHQKIVAAWDRLPKEEQEVARALWDAYEAQKPRITQRDIAQMALGLGKHEQFEQDVPTKKGDSTMRKVRQIIRNLRVDHHIPILSDVKGYWLPVSLTECREFLERMESIARAQAASHFETYRAMERTVGLKSAFFDQQESLFETNNL